MVLGILFNGFILVTFFHLPKKRNFSNDFVANLALADTLMAILSPALFILLYLEKIELITGETLRSDVKMFCSLASMFNFACISVDRMLAVAKPLYHLTLPRSSCIKVVVYIWAFSTISTVISHILSEVLDVFIITCLKFSVAFAIPTTITIISYATIAKVVLTRPKSNVQTESHDGRSQRDTLKITVKISIVILPGIVMWIIFWIPVFIEVCHGREEEIFPHYLLESFAMIPDVTALVNPIIFILMTSDYRTYLINLISRRN